ncbi:MAG: disulfide bond formation protein DsbA [Candidatus Chloroheliales bacterium]|nr:MAG: disulfide bond formation protein DsbA [Chloroflexota bacterium]
MALTPRSLPEVTAEDWREGPDDAPVTLLEYGDFECPYCGEAYPVIKQVQEQMGDRLRFVFRHFPITSSHPHAQLASEAAEAAGAHGKFWLMHDLLYENQRHLTREDLDRYAQQLGLDLDVFDNALEEHTYKEKVRDSFRQGIRARVQGTPTFFINGRRYDGEHTAAAMGVALEEAISNREKYGPGI